MATKQAKGQKIGRGSRSNSSKQQKFRSDRNNTKAVAKERTKGNDMAGVAMTPDQYRPNAAKAANRAEIHKKQDEALVADIKLRAKSAPRPSL